MPLDAAALKTALQQTSGASPDGLEQLHTLLCRREAGAFQRAAKATGEAGEPLIVACTQERRLFLELNEHTEGAAPLGVRPIRFVNIRETGGWSSDAKAAMPKIAALLAAAQMPAPQPVPTVSYRSGGRCLIVGAADAAEQAAAMLADGVLNRWFLDPAVLGRLPADVVAFYDRARLLPSMSASDLQLLAGQVVDFLGVNYYYPNYASAGAPATAFALNNTGRPEDDCVFAIEGLFRFVRNPRGRYTNWGWEIDASGLEELLLRAQALRPGLPIYVTENGIGLPDALVDGRVEDDARIAFLREHLTAVHRAVTAGANVRGYYMWSLLDNFSWVNGYKKRYGFLYVDRTTLARTSKKSAAWFRDVATANALAPAEPE